MTTMSKLGPWLTISLTIPLPAVEVVGDPGSDLSSKGPTLIRQSRRSRLTKCPYRSEVEAKKEDKHVRSVCLDSLTEEVGGNMVRRLVNTGASTVGVRWEW